MKAKNKETGEVFEVYGVFDEAGIGFGLKEIELHVDDKDSFDFSMTPVYWVKLKHQFAGMAMQGMLAAGEDGRFCNHTALELSCEAHHFANALINILTTK